MLTAKLPSLNDKIAEQEEERLAKLKKSEKLAVKSEKKVRGGGRPSKKKKGK